MLRNEGRDDKLEAGPNFSLRAAVITYLLNRHFVLPNFAAVVFALRSLLDECAPNFLSMWLSPCERHGAVRLSVFELGNGGVLATRTRHFG